MIVAEFSKGAVLALGQGEAKQPRLMGELLPYGVASGPSITDGRSYRFSGPPSNELVGAVVVREHDDATPIGILTEAHSGELGIDVTVELLPTSSGRDAHVEAGAGVRNGFSAGFDVLASTDGEDGVVDVDEWELLHVGHVRRPAFGDRSEAVAASTSETTKGATMPETTIAAELVADRVDLSPIEQRLDQIEARMSSAAPAAPARTLSVREALCAQLAASRETPGRRLLALADVVSGGNSGVLPPVWSREVRNVLDGMRYMFPNVGSMAFPASGHTLTIPKVVNHTTVAPRGAEKTEIPSSALTTDEDTYTATWYAGGVDIALEVILQSDPSIIAVVVDDMLRAYAATTDAALTLAIAAAGTPAGSVLDTSSYGAFVADIVTAGDQIRVATGAFGDRLCVTTATWTKIIGFVDTQGRRILSTTGATNADGSAQLTAGAVDIGGITVFHNPRAAEDVQFNTISARVAERPPLQVQADNVALMGRDLGLLGAVMDLPLYPAGIIVHSVAAMAASASRKK